MYDLHVAIPRALFGSWNLHGNDARFASQMPLKLLLQTGLVFSLLLDQNHVIVQFMNGKPEPKTSVSLMLRISLLDEAHIKCLAIPTLLPMSLMKTEGTSSFGVGLL